MEASKRRKPLPAANGDTAKMQKQHTDITASFAIREAVASITIGALLSVVMWSCILGMSGNMGPGDGVVLGPVAEASDHE